MSKNIINVTKNAWNKMGSIIKKSQQNNGFLFSISSGGCNGFNFNLNLIKDHELNKIKNMKPTILINEATNLYVDPMSEMYVIGTEIDYIKEDYSKGIFESKFIYNVDKKLASSCGCGVSFMPRNLK
tara:strand:- start:130 stop:510 length:381 start_codon:yes stop_codon:yes gene_type:complete